MNTNTTTITSNENKTICVDLWCDHTADCGFSQMIDEMNAAIRSALATIDLTLTTIENDPMRQLAKAIVAAQVATTVTNADLWACDGECGISFYDKCADCQTKCQHKGCNKFKTHSSYCAEHFFKSGYKAGRNSNPKYNI